MDSQKLAGLPGFEVLVEADARPVTGVYCADLLSWAMARAPEGSAWCTVMGNVNAVAVAALTEVAAIVLCEGAALDEAAKEKAAQQDIPILRCGLPAFEAGLVIARAAGLHGL